MAGCMGACWRLLVTGVLLAVAALVAADALHSWTHWPRHVCVAITVMAAAVAALALLRGRVAWKGGRR